MLHNVCRGACSEQLTTVFFLTLSVPASLPFPHLPSLGSLLFEYALLRGLFRLFNQALIFALLLVALKLSGDPSAQRGI